MNKFLVVVYDHEAAADAGLNALRALHAAGDITLYATSVLMREAQGAVVVRKSMETGPAGTVIGLAVGSLVGLLGGPVGLAIGAVTGTVAGAVRDYWFAGVGLDFIEAATHDLKPGHVALVAEIEEEWVTPLDLALQATGGRISRRSRTELAQAYVDHDIASFKAEMKELESEAAQAQGATQAVLKGKLAAAKAGMHGAVQRARLRMDTLMLEADAKLESLKLQLGQVQGDVKARIEDRIERVKSASHTRNTKLSRAWSLTKEALVP